MGKRCDLGWGRLCNVCDEAEVIWRCDLGGVEEWGGTIITM